MNFKKRLLISVATPLAICLTLTLALFFVGSDISRKVINIQGLKGTLFFKTGLTGSLAILSQQSELAKNYEIQLKNILPTQDQLIAFPKNIVGLGKESNFNLNTTIGQGGRKDGEKASQTDFTINGRGSFENFLTFLRALENSQYFIKFKTIDIAKQDRDFDLLMSGEVFSF